MRSYILIAIGEISAILARREFTDFLESRPLPNTTPNIELYPPGIDNLYPLYVKVRQEKVIAILEFGSGWSTVALTKGLGENRRLHTGFVSSHIRHPNLFSLMTVDCSKIFQSIATEHIPKSLEETKVIGVISSARMTSLNGAICTLFDSFPPFTADFIYLDSPDCDQVKRDVNGMHIRFGSPAHTYGMPMAADLLLREPYF